MPGGIGQKRSEFRMPSLGAKANMEGVKSLFSGFNSPKVQEGQESLLASEREELLTLDMDDEELRKLKTTWKREWNSYYNKDIKNNQERNYNYWIGKQYGSDSTAKQQPIDNVIFEALETLLPMAARENPEPYCIADNTDDGIFFANNTSKILERKADDLHLKSDIQTLIRNWGLYYIGCFKMGWNPDNDDMYFQLIDSKKIMMDPKGYFSGGEFKGRFIGEQKSASAEDLAKEFPNFAQDISDVVAGKMGTVLNYTEWWTNDYVFWEMQDIILDKRINPYWNGSEEEKGMDEYGNETVVSRDGVNHFSTPKMPYAFLSVFSTGKQPHDDTCLVEQSIPSQDVLNKRLRQIDKNADQTNNSWILSSAFSQDQGQEAVQALKNGTGGIIAPTETPGDAVTIISVPPLPQYIYQDMIDKREQIYNIMGVRGSTAQGTIKEQTVRGKIQVQQNDTSRLSLIVERVEQCVDHLLNLAVQTMYVYYTPEHVTRILGEEDGMTYYQMMKTSNRALTVTVKEGSTIPQDALGKRNEAIDLWGAGAIDPETFYERLDFPNPKETTQKLVTYTLNPQQYLADIGVATAAPVMPGTPPAPVGAPAGAPPVAPPVPPPANTGALPPIQ